MSAMGELTFFLSLQVKQSHEGIFISQDKYVIEILKKFDFESVKSAITPMETKAPLAKDEGGPDVDLHLYRSMIGCLTYLTASRPDIMYAVCACSRFQEEKSTTGGCQFLGRRLIHGQAKSDKIGYFQQLKLKHQLSIIDNQSTICLTRILSNTQRQSTLRLRNHFIRNAMRRTYTMAEIHTDLNVADLLTKPFDGPRYYLKFERMLQAQLGHEKGNASCHLQIGCKLVHNQVGFLLKPAESAGYTQIVDFLRRSKLRYALTHNPPIYNSLVKQFWQTATAKTLADGTQQLNATIDYVEYTITEESVRRQLQLADDSGITMLQNEEIFEGLQNIGYLTDRTFTFWKSHFTPQWRFLIHHILHCISSKSGGWDQFGSNIATALICLSTGRVFNFSKPIFDGMISNLKSKSKFLMYPRFLQMILNVQTENKNLFVSVILTKKIFGNMKRGFQGIHRPLLPAMLTIDAGQVQPSSVPTPSQLVSTPTPPPVQTPTPSTQSPPLTQPVPSTTPPPIPTPTPPPIPTPTPLPISTPTSPPPPPETEPTTDEHIYEEQTPVHHHFSPSQAQAPSHMSMDDLLQTVPKLISRIDSLEMDLKQTKLTMGNAIVKLVKKVKKLEGFIQRRNLVLTDSKEEEPEAQGIKFQNDPQDSSVQGLVTPPTTKVNTLGEEQVEEISPNTLEAAKTLSKVASLKSRSIDKGRRYKRKRETKDRKVVSSLDFQEEFDTGAEQVSTANEEVNTASEINTGSIKLNTGIEQDSTVGEDKGQREGKAPILSEETPKKSKEQILQEEASLAEAIRLDSLQKEERAKQIHLDSLLAQRIAEEEELTEQQMKRKAQVQFEAQHYTNEDWDLIRAKLEANAELSKNILGSEIQGEDFAKKMVDLLKTYMMNYLKNQGTWKLTQLRKLSFEEVKEEFDKLVKQIESFVPMSFEATKANLKRFGEELQTKTPKRLKEEKDDEAKDVKPTKMSGKRRKQMARKGVHTSIDLDSSEDSDKVGEQEETAKGTETPINPVPVAMKTPSVATYKIIKQGEKGVYQIVREDGTDVVYINFGAMMKSISRDDLTKLYRIVMNRYGMDGPEDKLEKGFWKCLRTMFEEPLSTDPIWSEIGQKKIISWRYYDTCRAHCLNLESIDVYMLSDRKYPLSAEVCQTMLKMKLLDGKMNEDCYRLLKMMEKQAGIRK
ncbi:hypothetical protein Tco_0209535 [Tanacetum coccineum]